MKKNGKTKLRIEPRPSRPTHAKAPRYALTPWPMQRSSELWLEYFHDFCMALTDSEQSPKSRANLAYEAGLLADSALKEYENRWPGVTP